VSFYPKGNAPLDQPHDLVEWSEADTAICESWNITGINAGLEEYGIQMLCILTDNGGKLQITKIQGVVYPSPSPIPKFYYLGAIESHETSINPNVQSTESDPVLFGGTGIASNGTSAFVTYAVKSGARSQVLAKDLTASRLIVCGSSLKPSSDSSISLDAESGTVSIDLEARWGRWPELQITKCNAASKASMNLNLWTADMGSVGSSHTIASGLGGRCKDFLNEWSEWWDSISVLLKFECGDNGDLTAKFDPTVTDSMTTDEDFYYLGTDRSRKIPCSGRAYERVLFGSGTITGSVDCYVLIIAPGADIVVSSIIVDGVLAIYGGKMSTSSGSTLEVDDLLIDMTAQGSKMPSLDLGSPPSSEVGRLFVYMDGADWTDANLKSTSHDVVTGIAKGTCQDWLEEAHVWPGSYFGLECEDRSGAEALVLKANPNTTWPEPADDDGVDEKKSSKVVVIVVVVVVVVVVAAGVVFAVFCYLRRRKKGERSSFSPTEGHVEGVLNERGDVGRRSEGAMWD
jgi:hypothetical protein